MISGFNKDRINVDIKYFDTPTVMSDSFFTHRPSVNVFRIRFNNLFKNEKLTYAAISVLLSIFLLIAGYGIYMFYGFLQEHAYENTALKNSVLTTYEDNIISFAPVSSNSNNMQSLNNNPLVSNNGNGFEDGFLSADNKDKTHSLKEKEILNETRVSLAVPDNYNPNPFLPYNEKLTPTDIQQETNAINKSKLVKTVISGIMFDRYSPSAIINIEGTDYLAKKGDTINSYKILNITQDTVTVKLGNNVYKAGVGEILAQGRIHYNNVPDLDKRFGGSGGIDEIIMKSKQNTK